MKLEIGCGKNPTPGYLHTDARTDISEPDIICMGYALPFKDETFDEIYNSGVFEHFMLPEAHQALIEWKRVLKPGGIIDFNVPDVYRWAKYLVEAVESQSGRSQEGGYDQARIMMSLYGWQGHTHDIHKFGWTEALLVGFVVQIGFVEVHIYRRWAYAGEADAHLCLRARKPDQC